jgi:hypothetical protein
MCGHCKQTFALAPHAPPDVPAGYLPSLKTVLQIALVTGSHATAWFLLWFVLQQFGVRKTGVGMLDYLFAASAISICGFIYRADIRRQAAKDYPELYKE